ncbi:hypothetical protein [Janthinobacterium sp. HH106]|nr:hypothetical protein [Janthinobacterium sp. HH106]
MSAFRVTVKTSRGVTRYYALASTAASACEDAVEAQCGEPCGVTAHPL